MPDRVEMRLRGRMLEKFISRAMEAGICLIAAERTSPREMHLTASSREARRLMLLAEEYRMDLTVLRETGLPVWRRKFQERGSAALGIMLAVALIVLFTSRIWQVRALSLDGAADPESLRAIEQTVQELGILPGMPRSSVDRDMLALNIQTRWPEFSHVSVRLQGVYLQIEVASEAPAPEVYDLSSSRDLVALKDAVVVHVEALVGKPAVQPGDTVRRGQVLIRGEERIDTDLTRGVQALGEVIGRTWFGGECTLPLYETVREFSGHSNTSSVLRLGRWSYPLSEGRDYENQEQTIERLPIGGLYLPVQIVRTTRRENLLHTVPLNEDEVRRSAEAQALQKAQSLLPANARQTDCWFECIRQGDSLTVRATIEAQLNIAAARSELSGSSDE